MSPKVPKRLVPHLLFKSRRVLPQEIDRTLAVDTEVVVMLVVNDGERFRARRDEGMTVNVDIVIYSDSIKNCILTYCRSQEQVKKYGSNFFFKAKHDGPYH